MASQQALSGGGATEDLAQSHDICENHTEIVGDFLIHILGFVRTEIKERMRKQRAARAFALVALCSTASQTARYSVS